VEVRLIYQGERDNGIVALGMTQRSIVCLDDTCTIVIFESVRARGNGDVLGL